MAMLEVKDLEVYYGMIQAIKGISFEVNQGEVIALIGANGAGKTTTLHTITGLLSPKKGSVMFEGTDITKIPAHKIVSMGMAHVPEGRRVFAELSVGQVHAGEFLTGFFQSSALAENPWDKFELSYVFFIRDRIGICGISDKVQSGHAESLFIDRVVVKWIAVGNMSHTDDCIVLIQNPI